MEPFVGTISELRNEITRLGIVGTWALGGQDGRATFTTDLGQILNWWPKKGTIQIQGRFQKELRAALTGGRFRATAAK